MVVWPSSWCMMCRWCALHCVTQICFKKMQFSFNRFFSPPHHHKMTGGAEAHIVLLLLITSQPKKKFFKKNISHGKKTSFSQHFFCTNFFLSEAIYFTRIFITRPSINYCLALCPRIQKTSCKEKQTRLKLHWGLIKLQLIIWVMFYVMWNSIEAMYQWIGTIL